MKRNSRLVPLYLFLLPSLITVTPRIAQGFNPQPEPPGKEAHSESKKNDEPLWEPAPGTEKQLDKKPKKKPGKAKELNPQGETTGMPVNPVTIVEFNPQPDPPRREVQAVGSPVPAQPSAKVKKTVAVAQQGK